jgi:hypothetical protein
MRMWPEPPVLAQRGCGTPGCFTPLGAVRQQRKVIESDKAVNELAAKYREVLVEMDAQRIEQGGKPRSWNQLVNCMQALQLRLRSTQSGRDVITALIGDENPTVRSWPAVNALAWAESAARAELEREVETDSGPRRF